MNELQQGKTHFLDHDYRGRWYLIPNNLYIDWARLVQKGNAFDRHPLAWRFARFLVKPTPEMRRIYGGQP